MSDRTVAVVGSADCTDQDYDEAVEIGVRLASAGYVVVTGGGLGVMEAACRGAFQAGGITVGILPGLDVEAANSWVRIPIATGLGETRNAIVARSEVVIAVGGEYGTLSEIALALKMGRPVIGLRTWDLSREGSPDSGIRRVQDAAEAVRLVQDLLQES